MSILFGILSNVADILEIFLQTRGDRCRTWTKWGEVALEATHHLLQIQLMDSVRLAHICWIMYIGSCCWIMYIVFWKQPATFFKSSLWTQSGWMDCSDNETDHVFCAFLLAIVLLTWTQRNLFIFLQKLVFRLVTPVQTPDWCLQHEPLLVKKSN